jgi:alanine dehydrogenase
MPQVKTRQHAGAHEMLILDDASILELVDPSELIRVLKLAFLDPAYTPNRTHDDLPGEDNAQLLIMPSWSGRNAIGVKVITAIPSNAARGLPTINGVYVLLDGQTGRALATLSAAALTALRTAAVCALAASVLAREDSKVLLMIGTGALAPHLVRAYLAVRPLERVILWGRDERKAAELSARLADLPVRLEVVPRLSEVLSEADMISSATLARTPLIEGDRIAPGTHVDLVGSFTREMREADSRLFQRGRLIVDVSTAIAESGDVAIPLREGAIALPIPDLTALLRDPALGRTAADQITIFKSVGTGLADLATARYLQAQHTARTLPELP